MKVVLDASAVLAVLQEERGQEVVLPHLHGGIISAVNYSEVLKKSAEYGKDIERVRAILASFMLLIVPFDEVRAVEVAQIWSVGRRKGLSFADRACIALAMSRNATILTTEGGISSVELPVKVTKIR